MGFLTFFSPLYINFEGLNIPSWIKSLVIGGSTVGKSETIRKLIVLLKAGQIVSGEMATVAGLAGAAVQASGGQWFVDFGVLPMLDRKLLAIDGAHILRQEELAKLAEAERNGKIDIVKASKGEAYARTRQIKIMNPVDDDKTTTVSMSSFFYPVNSLTNNFHIQSIARIDLACFVSDDVSASERNVPIDVEYDLLLEDMSELLRLIWSMKYTIKFTDGAMSEILSQSTELETKFKNESIPLITNDQKSKLAKLSASLACLTCSFNETFDVVTVTDEHVKYISELITKEYHKAGLDELAKKTKHDTINLEILYVIVKDISRKINNDDKEDVIKILEWLAETGKFHKDELKEHFDLIRDTQLKPLLGYLNDEKIIKRSKSGFTVLRYGTEIGRFIVDFRNSSNSSSTETDTPIENNNENKKRVSLLELLEELERRKIKDFRCTTCNSYWKKTESTLEDIQDEHNEGQIDNHEIMEIKSENNSE
jgi:DNA replicative helicase MCM subunit Mcm2 (Cdc46/Mcm family)